MNLAQLSRLPDDIGPLGPPIRREQTKPAPAPTVQHREDGTLTTNPDGTMTFEPKVAESLPQPVPVWPFPHAPKPEEEPGAHGFMREPLKVGDMIKHISVNGRAPAVVTAIDPDGTVWIYGGGLHTWLKSEHSTWERA